MKTYEILEGAAEAIDYHGWFGYGGVCESPGTEDPPTRRLCAALAIEHAIGLRHARDLQGNEWLYRAASRSTGPTLEACEALRQGIDSTRTYGAWAEVVAWNNAKGRTKEEVTSMLRAVAATLRAKELAGEQPQLPGGEEHQQQRPCIAPAPPPSAAVLEAP